MDNVETFAQNKYRAHAVARRKVKTQHRDYVCWVGRDDVWHVGPATSDNLKAALLAVGTKGKFNLYHKNGWVCGADWRLGLVAWRKAKENGR